MKLIHDYYYIFSNRAGTFRGRFLDEHEDEIMQYLKPTIVFNPLAFVSNANAKSSSLVLDISRAILSHCQYFP